jgi:choice-of-anchor B domain-containing protein
VTHFTRLRLPAILLVLLLGFVLPAAWQRATAQEPSPGHQHATAPGSKHDVLNDPTLATRGAPIGGAPCIAGVAAGFPCNRVDLVGFVPTNAFPGAGSGSDLWGWTDPDTGTEYALMGHAGGVSFTDITANPPVLVGFLPSPVPNVLWRDVDVFDNHMYSVADGDLVAPHGLQIFDLTQLRGALPGTTFTQEQTTRYTGFGNGHTVYINQETGHGFVAGSNTCPEAVASVPGEAPETGGLHILDLNADPANPTFLGCDDTDGYTHETQCLTYRGPDLEHQGKEICFNNNGEFGADGNKLTLVDVTNPADPQAISRNTYEGAGYTHQGWMTDDQFAFVMNDEYDELNSVTAGAPQNYRTYFWDMRDLDNPVLVDFFEGPNKAIDHNLYIVGGLLFEGNYTAGLRILDASRALDGTTTELASFDTTPSAAEEPTAFAGVWGNYVFFPSGNIVLSDIGSGLFIVRHSLPNFEVTVDGPDGSVLEGDIASYTVTVTNVGNVEATNVMVTDTLNSAVEVDETPGTLDVGESVSYSVARSVSATDCASGLTNTVAVSSAEGVAASYNTFTPCEAAPTSVSFGNIAAGSARNIAPFVAVGLLGAVGAMVAWRRRRA